MRTEFLGCAKKHITEYNKSRVALSVISSDFWEERFSNAFAMLDDENGNSVQPDYRCQTVAAKPAHTIMKQVIWRGIILNITGDFGSFLFVNEDDLFMQRSLLDYIFQ